MRGGVIIIIIIIVVVVVTISWCEADGCDDLLV